MNQNFLFIIVIFCALSLSIGTSKDESESKEDEGSKEDKETKHDKNVEKERESKDDKDDDNEKDEEKDNKDDKDDDNERDGSGADKSKDDESKGDKSEESEPVDEEESKKGKKKDHSTIDSITHFSLKLFKKVAEEERHHSFALSALPIWKQLSCLLPGAEGETKKELRKVLYHGEENEEDVDTELFTSRLDHVLKVYSRIYITDDAKLKSKYSPKKRHRRSISDEEQGDESSEISNEKLNSMEDGVEADSKEDNIKKKENEEEKEKEKEKENKHYDKSSKEKQHKDDSYDDNRNSNCDYSTLFKQVDFSNVKEANKTINHDFDKTSHHKFGKVLSKGIIDKKTKMLMINAVEFKGKLLESFDEKRTVKKNFYNYKNKNIGQVKMMIKKAIFPYYYSTEFGASILELPYENKMSLFVFLPDATDIDAMDMLSKFKDPKKVIKKLAKMNDTKVEVHLPRFKATGNIHLHLKKALKHMGMEDIFKPEDANLQGFLKDEEDDFILNTVSQAFRFTVNEHGSEEAEEVHGSSVKFICNRPFAFMVIDKETDHPIITGEFNSPKDIHL